MASVVTQPWPGATRPPPGYVPDLENPKDVLHTINLATQILALASVTPFVAMRMWAQLYVTPPFLIDDWCCLISFILSVMYSCTALMSMAYVSSSLPSSRRRPQTITVNTHPTVHQFGGGYHSWEITTSQFQNYLKALYADTLVYGPNAWFVKATLLLITIRVFQVNRAFALTMYAFLCAMLGYYLPVLFIKINICRPIHAFWDSSVTPATCFNQRAIFVADTVISAVTDLAVLLAPVPVLSGLQMSWRAKAKIYCLLGAGGVATISSFVRMYLVIQLQKSNDQTVDFVRFNLLGTAEVTIGLICACLPSVNRMFNIWQQQRRQKQQQQPANKPPTWVFLKRSATDLFLRTTRRGGGGNKDKRGRRRKRRSVFDTSALHSTVLTKSDEQTLMMTSGRKNSASAAAAGPLSPPRLFHMRDINSSRNLAPSPPQQPPSPAFLRSGSGSVVSSKKFWSSSNNNTTNYSSSSSRFTSSTSSAQRSQHPQQTLPPSSREMDVLLTRQSTVESPRSPPTPFFSTPNYGGQQEEEWPLPRMPRSPPLLDDGGGGGGGRRQRRGSSVVVVVEGVGEEAEEEEMMMTGVGLRYWGRKKSGDRGK